MKKVLLITIFLGIFFYSSSVYGIKCHVCSSLVQDCVDDAANNEINRTNPCLPEKHFSFAKPECHKHKEMEIECGVKDSADSPVRDVLRTWYSKEKKGDVITPPGFENFLANIIDPNSHKHFTYVTCIKMISDQIPKNEITAKYTSPATYYGCGTIVSEFPKDLRDTQKIVQIFPDPGTCKQDLRNATTLKTWIKIWACGEDLCNKKDFGDGWTCKNEEAVVPNKPPTPNPNGSKSGSNDSDNTNPTGTGPGASKSSFIKGSLIFVLLLAFLSHLKRN